LLFVVANDSFKGTRYTCPTTGGNDRQLIRYYRGNQKTFKAKLPGLQKGTNAFCGYSP